MKQKPTHSLMSHSLAKALMESGVKHLDLGGIIGDVGGFFQDTAKAFTPQNTYQAQLAPTQTTNYSPFITQAGENTLSGYGNSQNIQRQQQELANALLAQSRGEGPNPALAQLAQTTGSNVSGQAALMAGQRGAGANAGLIARQVAQQGAGIQQNAAGQAAILRAQQQLSAQQALAQQQASMASGNLAEQGVNSQLYGASAGAQNAQNTGAIQNYGMKQTINSGVAQQNVAANQKSTGGLLGSVGGLFGIHGGGGGDAGGSGANSGAALASASGPAMTMAAASTGGEITSRGGLKTPLPDHLHHVAAIHYPEFAHGARDFRSGGSVSGQAKVAGDSSKNDVVPAMLSPGEEVLPRSVTQAPDAPQRAAAFVQHLMKREGAQSGYENVATSKKSLKSRLEALEKLCYGGAA